MPLLYKNCRDNIQPIAEENKEVHTFPQGISLKVMVIEQLKFQHL